MERVHKLVPVELNLCIGTQKKVRSPREADGEDASRSRCVSTSQCDEWQKYG